MKLKDILRDQSFWSLFVINVAIIAYYLYYNTGFKTLVWIYWTQSVLIGFFTFLELATIKAPDGQPQDKDHNKARRYFSGFFAFHFGFFHVVYFVFLFIITEATDVFDWRLFELSVGAFALDQLWNFIRLKQWQKIHLVNPQLIFFIPYMRVISMHFTILLPFIFGWLPKLGLFLVLKMFADLAAHSISLKLYGRPQYEDPTLLTTIK